MAETLDVDSRDSGSFRDPAGFVFRRDGVVYRQVNPLGREDFDLLCDSGLYNHLLAKSLLVRHEQVDPALSPDSAAYCVIRPKPVPFVSYPYEWCFSQLKAAALATLAAQEAALNHGMSLRDASAYNVQFVGGHPLLIDTLSFESYREGAPWVAYRQFCQHFLAPLALMSMTDVRLLQLLRVYIDGIPLDLAARLLPFRSRLRLSLLTHIRLHARSQKHWTTLDSRADNRRMSKKALFGLVDSLKSAVNGLNWKPDPSTWSRYYDANSYSQEAFEHKQRVVTGFLERCRPASVWDMGANTGVFSRIAARMGILTVAFDMDPAVVEADYRQVVADGEKNLLPLWFDLANPSPDLGWDNRERGSIRRRGSAEMVLALALVHHLAIGNNVPLTMIARSMARLGSRLVMEFVPREDPQVQRLLSSREDIFEDYTPDGFESAFTDHYRILDAQTVEGSGRRLYLMERKSDGPWKGNGQPKKKTRGPE